jgi:hypothetical protein
MLFKGLNLKGATGVALIEVVRGNLEGHAK